MLASATLRAEVLARSTPCVCLRRKTKTLALPSHLNAHAQKKGYSAVFYRPSVNGDGVKLYHSNNADGTQFAKKEKCERDGRGRPIKD